MIKNVSKHPAILHAQDIADICRPLHKLNITYFSHVNIDKEKKFSALSNHPEFTHHYLKNKYYNVDIHMAEMDSIQNYCVWDSIQYTGLSAKMNVEARELGLRHTFTIIQKNNESQDYYHFATHLHDSSINQRYLANMDLLKLFIMNFKSTMQLSKSLSSVYDVKFSIDDNAQGYTIKLPQTPSDNTTMRKSFLDAIQLNEKFLIDGNRFLSLREIEILYWLHNGKTANDIACLLGIAAITVNKHIANIKTKTQCYTQFQLGELFSNLFNASQEVINTICK